MWVRVPLSIQKKNIKNNENYFEVSNIFVIFVLWKFFEKNVKIGPLAQLVRAADSIQSDSLRRIDGYCLGHI